MAEKKAQTKAKTETKAEIKKTINAGANYVGANVRDKDGKIISYIPNGKQVVVTDSFDPKRERTNIIGIDKSGNEVKGSVLTAVLK